MPLNWNYVAAGLLALLGLGNSAPTQNFPSSTVGEAFAARSYFYVGGNYVEQGSGHVFSNQMYVERLVPLKPTQTWPLVFIHGQGQTGTVMALEQPNQRRSMLMTVIRIGLINRMVEQAGQLSFSTKAM